MGSFYLACGGLSCCGSRVEICSLVGQGKLWRGFRPHPALQSMHTCHDVGALANHEEFGDIMINKLMADDDITAGSSEHAEDGDREQGGRHGEHVDIMRLLSTTYMGSCNPHDRPLL